MAIVEDAFAEGVMIRAATLKDALYIHWTGSVLEIVDVLRAHGLNAVWMGDLDEGIEIRPGRPPQR